MDIKLTGEKHIICSVAVAATQLGISRQSLNTWIKDNQFPKEGTGVDLTALLKMRRETSKQGKGMITDTGRKLKAEADYKTYKALQEEMVTLQMMGELIPQEQVKDALEMLFLEVRQTLLTLPDNVKTRVYGIDPEIANDCAEIVNETVTQILIRLANGNDAASTGNVGEKPKKRYTKRKKGLSSAAAGNG